MPQKSEPEASITPQLPTAAECTVKFLLSALQAKEKELKAIHNNVNGVLFYVTVEPAGFRFASVNQAFLDITGLRKVDVEGRLVPEVIPAPSCELVIAKYQQAISTRATVRWTEETPYPSGIRYGDVSVTPVFDESGLPTHLIGFVYDITQIKNLEAELRSAVELRDEFLSIASHELKTPLTALHLQLQMMLRQLKKEPGDASPRIQGMAQNAFGAAQQLASLLEELLDITKIRVGKLSLERKPMSLTEAALKAISLAKGEAHQKGSEILFEGESVATGQWDPRRMDQILSNLLSNAIKYGEGNPVEVFVKTDQARGIALLEVTDHGIGIPADMQSRIFERFQRAASTDKVTGLGLGLYIVRQLVEAHGGSVSVRSEIGKGSTFSVELPMS